MHYKTFDKWGPLRKEPNISMPLMGTISKMFRRGVSGGMSQSGAEKRMQELERELNKPLKDKESSAATLLCIK